MHLIAGLGNPGPKYTLNRHNIGFMVVDELINRFSPSPVGKKEFEGELYKSGELLFLKPLTFMNLSGKSVSAVKNFYKIELSHIIVIHDDLDLAFGALRFKRGGSSGGHNGLKSIDSLVGQDYLRVRFGIGRPRSKEEVVRYVLSDFTKEELECLEGRIKEAADGAVALTKEPLDVVKSRFSKKALQCG